MIGARFKSNGRALTIIGSYDGHDEPPGYYYRFDGEAVVHWITATGAAVRFTNIDQQGEDMAKHQPEMKGTE